MENLNIDDNLHLERISTSMAPVIFGAIDANRQFLRKWLPFVDRTQRISDTEDFIRSIDEEQPAYRNEVYAIWYKWEFAGLIAYKDTDRANCKTELGYWMIENLQGKGIMTRSVLKLIELAFRKMNINRIQIKVALGNKKSAAIAKRLNFRLEGIERDGEKHHNRFRDLEVYSLLKKEWNVLSEKTAK